MIDIHSHILPGVDDGSPSFEASLSMLVMAAEAGTTDIAATPHCNDEFEFDPERNAQLAARLQAAIDLYHRGVRKITIHAGCDFHLSLRNFRGVLLDPARFTINRNQYLLAEFSDVMIFEGVANLFDQLARAGVRPIVTHPERNPLLQKKLPELRRWVDKHGCFLQITAHSYLGAFGPAAKAFAHALTDQGLAHIVASDAHDLTRRTPRLDQVHAYLETRYTPALAHTLCVENPLAVLHGHHLATTSQKPWYKLW